MGYSILIIDDNFDLCQQLKDNIEQIGYVAYYATNLSESKRILTKHDEIKVVFIDIMLGEENGIDILESLIKISMDKFYIMITGYGTVDSAVLSLKLGAFDYIEKPLKFERIHSVILNIEKLINKGSDLGNTIKLATNDPAMLQIIKDVNKLSYSNIPILILGEDGTGKELIADLIYSSSRRNDKTFLKINSSSFSESLLDNELFGHEKGAYTGASSVFKGVFEKADEGTLFLDEIGDMPLSIQTKILRAIQNFEIRRIGSSEIIKIDVRFITATNRNILDLIEEKLFRKDLFYRLNTAIIKVPPLRERKCDIPLLVDSFLKEFSKNENKIVDKVSKIVLNNLIDYDWPGNIRELRNLIQYSFIITSKKVIDMEDLPPSFLGQVEENSRTDLSLLEISESETIKRIMIDSNNNKKKVAEQLNISRSTLYEKLRKYSI